MESSDLPLLQTAPAYHIQAILKTRQAVRVSASQSPAEGLDPTSANMEEIAAYLFEPRACRELLHTLGEAEVCILRELVACGGRANSRDLALYFSSPGSPFVVHVHVHERSVHLPPQPTSLSTVGHAISGSSLYPPPHPHGVYEQALHRLLLLGLLFWGKQTNFIGRDYSSGVYDGVLIVPPTIVRCVRQEWQQTEQAGVAHDDYPGEGMRTLQRALYLYWSLVDGARDGLPLVSSRLLARTALRQVLEHFASFNRFWSGLSLEQIHIESDVPYLLFLRLLLMQLGLLVEHQGTVRAVAAREFFALPLAERAWRCFHIWLETSFWNELNFISNVVAQPGPAPLDPAHEEVVYSRQLVGEHVLRVAPENWHAVQTFIARMKLQAPYLLFPRQYGLRAERYSPGSNPYSWNFRLRRGWLTHREGWHIVEGGFIRSLIMGPLYWLGVVELNEAEHPDAFCLVPAAHLIERSEKPVTAEETWGRLVVQPNFDLVALAPVSETLLIDLDRFADRVRLEHIAQYHLSRTSVTRAIQLGLTAGDIQQQLEQATGGTIPQNVQYSLVEWERQARRIELWRGATLLEVDDPVFLDTLFADEQTRAWLLRRLAPTLAEVATEYLTQFQEALWQHGYTPTISSASQDQDLLNAPSLPVHEAQWKLLPDGLLQPCYALANLYLVAELEHITEMDRVTGWRKVTPDSLQQALRAGFTLEGIIRFLQHYCAGGVPGSFLIRLKLWGSGYTEPPAIQVEDVPLLSLSAQALQDVLADEEIGPLLGVPVSREKRLVRVSPDQLERVKALLHERGFDVS